ncbi:NmrA family protein [Kribbella flavida DSM 17836]|uniref:NmrA family protein n=1 Tax=Kribbella flavida (strain DSM 17836 / JCM 10339 / NBRC 14399) TaxID=479435 RepID=D2Q3T5_KRIFD|nr:NAD(P)H-binding protein [Kribbella flavida]ADB35957.1 NmrA family protein [Kribbella flavida DSM 17836]
MTTTPILILGGKGKTGRRVVQQLAARGVPVRTASRSSEQRFDWYDESTWAGTVAGSKTAYLAPPVGPAGLAQAGRFVRQAAAEGLRRVVLLSGRGVGSPEREFAVYESSVELEQAVKDSGADWTIVRPAWFMQGFSEDFLVDHVLAGELRVSAGTGAEAWIDADDIGDVMATVLLDPSHTGRIYSLSGPRTLTMAEVAAELSAATGREIRYADLDPEQHVTELMGIGLPREDAESVRDLFAVIRHHRSEYLSDDGVREVLGRAPRDFTDWARETARTGVWSA